MSVPIPRKNDVAGIARAVYLMTQRASYAGRTIAREDEAEMIAERHQRDKRPDRDAGKQ